MNPLTIVANIIICWQLGAETSNLINASFKLLGLIGTVWLLLMQLFFIDDLHNRRYPYASIIALMVVQRATAVILNHVYINKPTRITARVCPL